MKIKEGDRLVAWYKKQILYKEILQTRELEPLESVDFSKN